MNIVFHLWNLAQVMPPMQPGDDGDAAPVPAPRRVPELTIDDLQQGMRNWRHSDAAGGQTAMRNWLLVGVALLALLVLVVQLHQRWKNKRTRKVDSEFRLFRELTHGLGLPFGSTFLIWWIAYSSRVSMSSLLISPTLFRQSSTKWRELQTFGIIRQMFHTRVDKVERMLFD